MNATTHLPADTSHLAAGEIIHLAHPEQRSPAIYQLVANLLPAVEGDIYWIDAHDHASPTVLADHLHEQRLRSIHVARGVTAYQHHAIVRDLPETLGDDAGLIVCPAAARLYRDGDVPDYEAEPYFSDTITTLTRVATDTGTPVIVSTASGTPGDLVAPLSAIADRTIRCERTSLGYRFEGDAWETTVYWADGWWQTTIPYWVDLFGTVDDRTVETMVDQGAPLPMGAD